MCWTCWNYSACPQEGRQSLKDVFSTDGPCHKPVLVIGSQVDFQEKLALIVVDILQTWCTVSADVAVYVQAWQTLSKRQADHKSLLGLGCSLLDDDWPRSVERNDHGQHSKSGN